MNYKYAYLTTVITIVVWISANLVIEATVKDENLRKQWITRIGGAGMIITILLGLFFHFVKGPWSKP